MNIFAPNLYVCAYHLQGDLPRGAIHPLWQDCDRLLSHLTSTQLIPHLHSTQGRVLLPPDKKGIPFNLTNHPEIEGFIQPVQLQDSYGVFLNIGYDDSDPTQTVDISALQQFNASQILPLPNPSSFIGKTLLLTLGLTTENQAVQESELTQLANQCYEALFQQIISPSRLGELFDPEWCSRTFSKCAHKKDHKICSSTTRSLVSPILQLSLNSADHIPR